MSRSDIDALNAQLVQGIEKGDAAMVASLYAPDAQLMPPGMPMATGDGIRQVWQGVIDMGVNGGALKTLSLEELGDTAIETGQYEMHVGSEVVDVGKFVVVHRKTDDGWKLGIDIFNSDRSPEPAA